MLQTPHVNPAEMMYGTASLIFHLRQGLWSRGTSDERRIADVEADEGGGRETRKREETGQCNMGVLEERKKEEKEERLGCKTYFTIFSKITIFLC